MKNLPDPVNVFFGLLVAFLFVLTSYAVLQTYRKAQQTEAIRRDCEERQGVLLVTAGGRLLCADPAIEIAVRRG